MPRDDSRGTTQEWEEKKNGTENRAIGTSYGHVTKQTAIRSARIWLEACKRNKYWKNVCTSEHGESVVYSAIPTHLFTCILLLIFRSPHLFVFIGSPPHGLLYTVCVVHYRSSLLADHSVRGRGDLCRAGHNLSMCSVSPYACVANVNVFIYCMR